MATAVLSRNERDLRLVLEPYKNKLATFQRVPFEFEAKTATIETVPFRSGDWEMYATQQWYGNGRYLRILQRHTRFKAKLVGWELEEYQAKRYGEGANWDTVWLHFETMTGEELPFRTPERLAIQNGKWAAVWQDELVEYGLVEGVDFKHNTLGDMLILSDAALEAIQLVDPPKPMVIQFSAQAPVDELDREPFCYWHTSRYAGAKPQLQLSIQRRACSFDVELVEPAK